LTSNSNITLTGSGKYYGDGSTLSNVGVDGIVSTANATAITIDSNETVTLNATGGANYSDATSKVLKTTASQHTIFSIETSSTGGHQAALELESNGNPVSIATSGSNTMDLITSGSSRIRISSAGNVGIGTTSPVSALNVNGISVISGVPSFSAGSVNAIQLEIYNNSSTSSVLRSYNRGASTYGDIGLGETSRFVVKSDGNVGIGTSSPSARLDVTTASAGWGSTIQNTNSASDSNGLLIKAGTTASEYALKVSNPTDTTNYMVVKGSGNVGLGTTSPGGTLHVSARSGTTGLMVVGSSGNNIAQFYDSSSNTKFLIKSNGTSEWGVFGTNSMGAEIEPPWGLMSLSGTGSSSQKRMRFYNSNGEVGNIKTSGTGTTYATGTTGGIDFSNNTHASGMTGEMLHDYEEGYWTPTLAFNGSSTGITYSAGYTLGRYTKIGNLVTASTVLIINNKGSATGGAQMFGLPFNSENLLSGQVCVDVFLLNVSNSGTTTAYMPRNNNLVTFQEVNSSGVTTDITNADVASNAQFQINVSYRV
jgi:hypothetical protein